MYSNPENSVRREAERQARTYAKLVELAETLLSAEEEGVFEVSIRSHSFTATLPVSFEAGGSVIISLFDFVSDRISALEGRMLVTTANMGEDAEAQYQRGVKADQEREEKKRARMIAYEQQVAATYSVAPVLAASAHQQPQPPVTANQVKPSRTAKRQVVSAPLPQNATSFTPQG